MRRDKGRERKIALERIGILMRLAEDEAKKGNLSRTARYVSLSRKISTRYNVAFPRSLKRKLCKNCNSFLLPSKNCRVRLSEKKVIIYCFECKEYTRIPFQREKKASRAPKPKPDRA
jgi:ribonuclease P protein subunit RPR2